MKKLKVYIASPYTEGDQVLNVRIAISIAEELVNNDFIPFVPHLYHLWNLIDSHEKSYWMYLDLEWLKHCDAIYIRDASRISDGMQQEIALAAENKIPIFYYLTDIIRWRERGY